LQELVHLGPAFSNSFVSTRALAINNNNFIVGDSFGYFSTASGVPLYHAFLWNPHNGPTQDLQDLGDLGGLGQLYSSPRSINDNQQVVGISQTGMGQWHAFIWDSNRKMEDISVIAGDPQADEVGTGAINNAQQVVGTKHDLNGGTLAFVWLRGQPFQLVGMSFGQMGPVYDINESGVFVGSGVVPISGENHAVKGSIGGISELSGFRDKRGNAGGQSEAYGINEDNVIVGYAQDSSGHQRAVIWLSILGPPKDLNELIHPCDAKRNSVVLWEARAINKWGDIAATGSINGSYHAFLLSNLSAPGAPPAPVCPSSPTP
jgi:probable HAF family extracellular repeat protein